MILHAGLIARRLGGYWRGVLIQGPAGVGKSDLALRALNLGFRLVSDDRTHVFAAKGRLFGRAPDRLVGQIEVRGLGVTWLVPLHLAQIDLVVTCVSCPDQVERLPEPRNVELSGVTISGLDIWPHAAGATQMLNCALETLGL